MIEEPDKPGMAAGGLPDLKLWIGLGLLALGVGVAGWVLLQVLHLFNEPQAFRSFFDLIREDFTIRWNTGNLTLPAELLGYLIPITLLSIAGGFAHVFIVQGVNLLRNNWRGWRRV
ncbi:hypothetical protein TFLX_02559 [Thermoflexales bacterium]|jgi:hypothetical protein|nr:hypothetical protein TFLX_02559 [Thermoflexales bacterium]